MSRIVGSVEKFRESLESLEALEVLPISDCKGIGVKNKKEVVQYHLFASSSTSTSL